MKPEDILFDLRRMTRERPGGIPMFTFRSIMIKKYKVLGSHKNWSSTMRYLVNQRKIEVFGSMQMIRPVESDMERNINHEVRLDGNLIKDIIADIGQCTPSEAYRHCVLKYGYCNPESFTRKMRSMAEIGNIFRDDKGKYSLKENSQKELMAYAEE